jgi:peptidoglycan/LPS O-acetylase OafA/YrhL
VAPKTNRIPALDGVRGLAIGLVLLFHGFFAPLGNLHNHPLAARMIHLGSITYSGVDLFFVLSGFLIGGILLDAAESRHYFAAFYIRRAHRIVQLYAVVLAFVFFVLYFFPSFAALWMRNRIPLWYYLSFLQNFWMARHGFHGSNVLPVTWSLAVEEQFYLTLPVTIRFLSRSRLWWVVGGMIAGAPLLRMLLMHTIAYGPYACYVLMPCQTDALGFGLAAALMKRTPILWEAVLRWRGYVYVAMGGAFLGVVALMLSGFIGFSDMAFGLEYSLWGFFYFCLLLSVLIGGRLAAAFSVRALRYLGTIAYGVYLLHLPCMAAAYALGRRIYPDHPGGRILTAEYFTGIVVAAALAAISWEYLEKPLIKRGHRYTYGNEFIRDQRSQGGSMPQTVPSISEN